MYASREMYDDRDSTSKLPAPIGGKSNKNVDVCREIIVAAAPLGLE